MISASSLGNFVSLLGRNQVFSGKSDPVTIIQDGTSEMIIQSAHSDFMESKGRCIISAGCEITPGTSNDNMHSFKKAAETLSVSFR